MYVRRCETKHAPLSEHFCCLGRVPYGIRRYSTRCVRHGTIHTSGRYNKAGMLPSRNGTKIGTVHDFSLYRTARCSALHYARLMCKRLNVSCTAYIVQCNQHYTVVFSLYTLHSVHSCAVFKL